MSNALAPFTATNTDRALGLRAGTGRLILKMDKKEEVSAGGIILPEQAAEKPRKGTILSVGSNRIADSGFEIPMKSKVGDRVLVSQWAGNEFKHRGEEYTAVHEDDVLAWEE